MSICIWNLKGKYIIMHILWIISSINYIKPSILLHRVQSPPYIFLFVCVFWLNFVRISKLCLSNEVTNCKFVHISMYSHVFYEHAVPVPALWFSCVETDVTPISGSAHCHGLPKPEHWTVIMFTWCLHPFPMKI